MRGQIMLLQDHALIYSTVMCCFWIGCKHLLPCVTLSACHSSMLID